jgi:hypothetical protein
LASVLNEYPTNLAAGIFSLAVGILPRPWCV